MPYLLLSLAAIFWGGNYIAGHLIVRDIDPYLLSVIRWGGATILISAIYFKKLKAEINNLFKNTYNNLMLSFLGQVCFPLSLYIGLQYTSSLNAAIYISSTPCIVLLINHFLFKDKISQRNIVGVFASTCGVVYLAMSNNNDNLSLKFGYGDLLTIISALSWAFYCALLRYKSKDVSNTSFVAYCSFLGTIILIPVFLIHFFINHDKSLLFNINYSSLMGIAYLIIFPSWLSYVFWSKGVSMIGTTRSEIFTHIIPLSGGIMGIIFLGDNFRIYHAITMILIVFGIVCCSTDTFKKK